VKFLVAFALVFSLTAVPTARACTADVELKSSEYVGQDVLNTYQLTQSGTGPVTVTFEATTAYLRNGKVYSEKSEYSESFSGQAKSIVLPVHTKANVDEITSVKIRNITCAP
jgi:hypothetical protein